MKSIYRFVALSVCSAFVAACGGGGSGGDSTPQQPTPPATTYSIGGTLSGLASGASVALQNNGGANATLSANGTFTFTGALSSGAAYAVTVLTQPTGQTCTVTNGSGTATANVTNVAVACVTTPPNTFTVGGAVSGLAAGTSVVLQNNGGSNLTVSANGNFTFATAINSGATYAVRVLTQPAGQNCTVASGSGTAMANVTNVAVTCANSTFGVSGTVSGLIGSIVVQNNGAADQTISADGNFSFAAQLPGTTYAVTVASHPTGVAQNCNVTNGSGTIGVAAITNVVVVCVSVDQTAPTVKDRLPRPTAVGSKVKGGVVWVQFSEAIDPASVNTSSLTVQGPAGPVSGEITLANGNTEATFTPGSVAVPATLAYGTSYTVTLTTAVRDPSHNGLAANAVWTFDTGNKLAMGQGHTCARLDDGRVKCWGRNFDGQLGYDDTQNRGDEFGPGMATLQPVNLGSGRTAVALTADRYTTCALLDNRDVKCWGRNTYGQLGESLDGTNFSLGDQPGEMANRLAVNFGPGRSALEIASGEDFSCARLDNDTVKCWGLNTSGQLGQENTTSLGVVDGDIAAAPPINFGAGLTPRGLALGHTHACALLRDSAGANHVRCWGDNEWGQLARGNKFNVGGDTGDMSNLTDVDLGAGRTAIRIAAAGGHTCALLDNASVKCWGLNTWGQLGLNQNMYAANQQVCTAATDCVGDQPGEMGDVLTAAIPGNVAQLAVGTRHNCVLLTNGQLKCWGSNEQGQLGLGDNTGAKLLIGDQVGEMPALAATALKPGAVVENAVTGGFETCVWNTDDSLNCWGLNGDGQLGHDDNVDWGAQSNQMGAALPNTALGN